MTTEQSPQASIRDRTGMRGPHWEAAGRLGHLPTMLEGAESLRGPLPTGCTIGSVSPSPACGWHWLIWRSRVVLKTAFCSEVRSMRRLTTSGKGAGPAGRTLTLFPHLSWSWIPSDRSVSPRRTTPVMVSSGCLSQMAFANISFLHLLFQAIQFNLCCSGEALRKWDF